MQWLLFTKAIKITQLTRLTGYAVAFHSVVENSVNHHDQDDDRWSVIFNSQTHARCQSKQTPASWAIGAGASVLSTGLIKNNNSRHWKNTSHSEMINGSCAQYSSKRKIPFPYHHLDVYRPFGHVIPHLIIASLTGAIIAN